MAKARFRADYVSIGLMLRSEKMRREMVHRARTIMSYAVIDAPRRTGDYVSSFQIDSGREESPIRLGRGDRAWAMVRNTSQHAAAVEFGNERVPGQRVLGRAADRVTSA